MKAFLVDLTSFALWTASANAGTFPSALDGGAPEAEKLLILHPENHRTNHTKLIYSTLSLQYIIYIQK